MVMVIGFIIMFDMMGSIIMAFNTINLYYGYYFIVKFNYYCFNYSLFYKNFSRPIKQDCLI